MKTRDQLRILYIQIRADQETQQEEFAEFVRFSKLDASQFRVLNVFDEPHFEATMLDEYDALFIGGSSDDPEDTVALDPADYPFITDLEKIIAYAAQESVPTFASCFGFQVGTDVLGGEVILDKEHTEIGSYRIDLNEAAMRDPLFANTPQHFIAISGHKKRAKTLPPGAIAYASSELCPIHAYRLEGKPFYAFQFHPEIDRQDLVTRIKRYKDRGYLKGDDALEQLIDTCEETPYSNALVGAFVDVVLLGKSL